MSLKKNLIRTALGKEPADLIIKNGNLVNVHSGEIYKTDIAVRDGLIASIGPVPEGAFGQKTQIIDAEGRYLAPGFIDAHIHIESSMLTYTAFAKAVVVRGTTAVVSDLMEVTIVSGVPGLKALLKEAESAPVKLFYPIPSFMGEEEAAYQTTGSLLLPNLIEELILLPQAIGLAEVLYPPILAEDENSARNLALAEKYGKTAEGHAPALLGEALNAYAGTGIRSDHESTNKEEALAKLRAGLRILIREGSASSDLQDVIRILTEENVDTRYISFISDDIDALHIQDFGHQDHKVRLAVQTGVSPVKAIQMVTINPAESLKLDGTRGSILPGKVADIVILSSLKDCRVEKVIIDGQLIVDEKDGQAVLQKSYPPPLYEDVLLNTVRLVASVRGADLLIEAPEKSLAKVHVIGISGANLLADALEADLPVVDDVIRADIPGDVLHIACVERYGKNGNIGKSFVRGVGLKAGAIALSVGHDHHNITVVGTNGADMAAAVNRVAALNGGIVYVRDNTVVSEIALPVAGLLSLKNGDQVADDLRRLIAILKENGCLLPSPNVTLSFVTLIFIPFLAITDKGLFDVLKFRIIDPVISAV
ncbi:MAG: amidohydrolase family protein [Clostridiales Family XIII bacterium]|jgi:adenine deaminase|nr:amidohydrolase family protein [Clostridiales Family XIII bacterium]